MGISYARLAIAWGQAVVMLLLLAVTVRRLSRGEPWPWLTRGKLLAAWGDYLALLAVNGLISARWYFRILYAVLDWGCLAMAALLVAITIRYTRNQKKNTP